MTLSINHTEAVVQAKLIAPGLSDAAALQIVDKVFALVSEPPKPSIADMVVHLLANNSSDMMDLVNKIGGIGKLFEIMPDVVKLYQAAQSAPMQKGP